MQFSYDFYKSILVLNGNLTKETFLQEVGASRGYAKEMFERIYDSIHSELVDLREEYELYYSKEYPSFEHFLFRKMNISVEDIDDMIKFESEKEHRKIFRSDDGSTGDYGISSFIYSEEIRDRIMKIIT
ncbi:hypothetical protein [Tenacibaculum ascidiaceicola]|uniref:hypothetical protein n=1 Tax=Tenacibaculum ascidiaceicola TaxID=1699411 RepID=UPI00389583BD